MIGIKLALDQSLHEDVNTFVAIMASSGSAKEMLAHSHFVFEASTSDPTRPFEGQPHTMYGERGKQQVYNVRMRDLSDCLLRSIAYCCWEQLDEAARIRVDSNDYDTNELYKLNLNDADPVAIMQNLVVEVEKVMGVYPNVPELKAITS